MNEYINRMPSMTEYAEGKRINPKYTDLISRADAIEAVAQQWLFEASVGNPYVNDDDIGEYRKLAEELFEDVPSAETHEIRTETHGVCLISKDDAIVDLEELAERYNGTVTADGVDLAIDRINALPSADAVQGWRIGKPTEQGMYMVTLDSFGHKHIDLFYYGKPMMPNRKVRGKCWYRSDDEWGDVVYDDKDILAWMPLPTPYKGGAE